MKYWDGEKLLKSGEKEAKDAGEVLGFRDWGRGHRRL